MLNKPNSRKRPRTEREPRERRERGETRIKRDIRGWIGWDYITECVDLSENPLVILALFVTGGRATEVLDYTRGMFADMGGWYEARGLPVYKRYKVLRKIRKRGGGYRYETRLEVSRRTIPLLKEEPLTQRFWNFIKDRDRDERLIYWPEFKDQYWQMYKLVSNIPTPSSPLAPTYHTGEKEGQIKNLYPHWFRGMRAAQLRVQYNLDVTKLCDFFRWRTLDMARHYAGLSVVDMVLAMKQGERFLEVWENILNYSSPIIS